MWPVQYVRELYDVNKVLCQNFTVLVCLDIQNICGDPDCTKIDIIASDHDRFRVFSVVKPYVGRTHVYRFCNKMIRDENFIRFMVNCCSGLFKIRFGFFILNNKPDFPQKCARCLVDTQKICIAQQFKSFHNHSSSIFPILSAWILHETCKSPSSQRNIKS